VPSKKRSAARPPEGAVFFIDRSLGTEPIAAALREQGLEVLLHRDRFAPDEEDRVWLLEAGRRGWVVLTKDQRIRYHPLEKAALRAGGARVFILVAGNLRGAQIAEAFVRALPAIFGALRSQAGPFLATVTSAGEVRLVSERR